ncbi:TRAP transporter small permease [Comamonas flocculans]|uniref:TRAP transporter small permease protein n=2 Tax=Comamonas flocculans TaxID=2597701 RepID=A0A5B8S128_9BURK|nr:TRAP transporter small permease [Comamonas sp.]QEA14197.1 TRAP transporter small permease [Comamonas flocculans]
MRWMDRLEEYFLALMLAGMTLVTFGQVVARYVFNYSFTWAMELTGVMFAWMIFIGASYGVRVSAHIGIDALIRVMNPRLARAVALAATALCILYSCVLAFGGWQYLSKLYTVGVYMQDIPVPQWVPKIVLPFGFILLALRFGVVFYKLLSGQDVHLLGDEAEDALKMREEMEAKP